MIGQCIRPADCRRNGRNEEEMIEWNIGIPKKSE